MLCSQHPELLEVLSQTMAEEKTRKSRKQKAGE